MSRRGNRLPRGRRRSLITESLEPRLLLANDIPFQNPAQPFDVNRDLRVTALDALRSSTSSGETESVLTCPMSMTAPAIPMSTEAAR